MSEWATTAPNTQHPPNPTVSFRFVSFECGCAREWERVRRKFESPKLQNQKAELNQRVTTKQAEKRRRRRSKMCVTSRTVRLHYT